MSTALLDLLACPLCRGGLVVKPQEVTCLDCRRSYALHDGVTELLLEPMAEQRAPSRLGRAASTVVAQPSVYDLVQRLVGAERIYRRIGRALDGASGLVLDVGAGTGN